MGKRRLEDAELSRLTFDLEGDSWKARQAHAELTAREEERRDREEKRREKESAAIEKSALAAEATATATRAYVRHARNTAWATGASALVALFIAIVSYGQLSIVREQSAEAADALDRAEEALVELRALQGRLSRLGEGLVKIAYLEAKPVKLGGFESAESEEEIGALADELAREVYPNAKDRKRLLREVDRIVREGRMRRGLTPEGTRPAQKR